MRLEGSIALALLLVTSPGCGDFDSFSRRAGQDPAPTKPNNNRRIIINGNGGDAGVNPNPNPNPNPGQPDGWVPPRLDSGTAPKPDTVSPPPLDNCGHNPTEQQVFQLLNQERQKQGLHLYKCDPFAVKAARGHSEYMCKTKQFSHYANGTPSSRLKAAGATFTSCGENIAWGYQTPQAVHNGWMGSWGHRAAMLSKTFDRVGVGFVLCNGKTAYWTENFLK